MVGGEDDLSVSRVFIQGERWNRTDCVACGKTSNIFAHSIDNTGGFISQTGREYWGFTNFAFTPHYFAPVNADAFNLDTNFVRTRSGDFHFDEFEDFRPSGFRKLDGARHGSLRGCYDFEFRPFGGLAGHFRRSATVRLALCRRRRTVRSP